MRELVTIYALLNGSTSSEARPRIQQWQATTRKARAEQSQEPKKKAQKAKRRAGRQL